MFIFFFKKNRTGHLSSLIRMAFLTLKFISFWKHSTVWKFHNFSVSQILREINFGGSNVQKMPFAPFLGLWIFLWMCFQWQVLSLKIRLLWFHIKSTEKSCHFHTVLDLHLDNLPERFHPLVRKCCFLTNPTLSKSLNQPMRLGRGHRGYSSSCKPSAHWWGRQDGRPWAEVFSLGYGSWSKPERKKWKIPSN